MKCESFDCQQTAGDQGNLQPCFDCNKKFCELHLARVSGDLLCEDCNHCSQEGCTNPARRACASCRDLLCADHSWFYQGSNILQEQPEGVVCYPCDLKLGSQVMRALARVWGGAEERKAA